MRSALILSILIPAAIGSWISISTGGDNSTAPVIVKGKDTTKECWGYFNDTIQDEGYATFEVYTSGEYSDLTQSYCAGFLEGYLTQERIYQIWLNFNISTFQVNNSQWFEVETFTWATMLYVNYATALYPDDPYWVQVFSVYTQLTGMADGYSYVAPEDQTLTLRNLFLLNMIGDLDDLLPALARKSQKEQGMEVKDMADSTEEIRYSILHSHCSSIVKPNSDFSELFAAHEMWSAYFQMLGVYKYYHFQFSDPAVKSNQVSFSSYPGFLSSEDDFYITNNLVVMETTNGIFNYTLYDIVKPTTLMSWIRAIVSNRLAADGETWTSTMARENSGTYNNQWIVVDFKKFNNASPIPNGTLWIGSQIPGLFESADVTHVLNEQGYWPSYNIPYFKNIFDLAGYAEMVKQQGDYWSYDGCPRANIFRKRQGLVEDMDSLHKLMRYNDWEHDPFSLKCPLNQIASRLDLAPANYSVTYPFCAPAAFGAINGKATSSSLIKTFSASIIMGPTHEYLPPFSWSQSAFNSTAHFGQPDVFNFDWRTFTPFDQRN